MTLSTKILALAAAASFALTVAPALAQTSPATAIADGQPWKATGPKGRPMTLIFTPDGHVRAKMGFLSMSMTWEATADGMCLSGGPGGDKCITFIKTDTGYQGIENGQVTMQLSR